MKFIVCLQNANSPTGRAYLGGNGTDGFNTDKDSEAFRFDEMTAERYANHFRGWFRGFAGGADIVVLPDQAAA